MIKLNLQMFAKSVAYQREYRKSNAYATGKKIQEELKMQEKNEPAQEKTQEKKKTLGEAVSAVNMRETYEIYRVDNGEETPVIKDGVVATRTGRQVLEKMIFNKNRGLWENSQKRTYRVRKIRK